MSLPCSLVKHHVQAPAQVPCLRRGFSRRLHKSLQNRKRSIVRSTDYVATATDDGILQLPPKQPLSEEELVNVFGYDRDLQGKYVWRLSDVLSATDNKHVVDIFSIELF